MTIKIQFNEVLLIGGSLEYDGRKILGHRNICRKFAESFQKFVNARKNTYIRKAD